MVQSSRLIAIPAYNEAKSIAAVIKGLEVLNGFTVLVVNDGSTDNTAEVLKQFDCLTITHATNLGYEAALNSAFGYANTNLYDEIVFVDADGEHALADITEFSFLDDNMLVKVGSRQKKNRMAEYLAGIYGRLRFGVQDPYCGLKSYNLRKLRNYHFKHSAGAQIGTGLMKEIARKVGSKSISNIEIFSRQREGTSRFSKSNLYANIILISTLLK